MSYEQLGRFAESPKATAQHIGRILPFYMNFAYQTLGRPELYMHDPTAISFLLNPALFEVKQYPLKVETQGISRGKTWVWTLENDLPPETFGFDSTHPVNVVLGADVSAVNDQMLSIML